MTTSALTPAWAISKNRSNAQPLVI